MASILITGGTGFIGSHTALALAKAGHKVVLLDNLSNSDVRVLQRLERLWPAGFDFEQCDVRDGKALDRILAEYAVDSVIHFAGLKAVGESVAQPLAYFDNNLGGTLSLLQAMTRAGIHRFVFSSSATVYGDPESVPIPENAALSATNPYGRTKLMCEEVLRDLERADPRWAIAILRYFNPVGAHPSGLIGESPRGAPNNLMPYVAQVAAGQRTHLNIYGNDYPTPDGTGVRDYIHVMDLAAGHLAALEQLARDGKSFTVNLGTGAGFSVDELLAAFAKVVGHPIAHRYVARRPGDVAMCFADTTRARNLIGWQAELGLERMCEDAWRWQSTNPTGFGNL
ncbi:MAG: UDP-glucose 4-epimerase GalE [Burkholderiales bacterium]|nr:MAG: UDP-glucose 4-epimerase GalE [Burkholderiales bacterium]